MTALSGRAEGDGMHPDLAGLFDAGYVARRYGSATCVDSADAYASQGWPSALDPNALFDSAYYRAQIPPSDTFGLSPAEHYLLYGAASGLDPAPLFSTRTYLTLYPDIAEAGVNPLGHYLNYGAAEGRLPNLLEGRALAEAAGAVLARDPENPYARVQAAAERLHANAPDEALAILDGGPVAGLQALLVRVGGLLASGRRDAAITAAHAVADQEGAGLVARCGIAAYHAETLGRLGTAAAAYEVALAAGCEDPALFRFRLAVIFRVWGRLVESEEQARLALELGDTSPHTKALHDLLKRDRLQAERLYTASRAVPDFAPEAWQGANQAGSVYPQVAGLARAASARGRGTGLMLLDSSFPSRFSAFRYGELLTYLYAIPDSRAASSLRDIDRYRPDRTFLDELRDFEAEHPTLAGRVSALNTARDLSAKVLHTTFLHSAAVLLASNPDLQAERFVFTLYPGGSFAPNDPVSDAKLRRVLGDRRFAKVVTTHTLQYRYLLDRGWCDPDQIAFIFGAVSPDCWDVAGSARCSRLGRPLDDTIRVCFVAQRYTERGVEKGCDVFTELVRRYADDPRFEWHYVGDWTPELLGLTRVERVRFHGVQPASFFLEFYIGMDIVVSPNLSQMESEGGRGSFDGFPTTSCVEAGLRGVAMFLSDSLELNRRLDGTPAIVPGEEFELITRDVDGIAAKIAFYAEDREALRRLSERGRLAILREYSFERQMRPRLDLLQEQLDAD
jgi:glycosyltransferase involved in cell wall biosynthesis